MTSTSDNRVSRLGMARDAGSLEEVKSYMYADAVHSLDLFRDEGTKYSSTALSVAIDKNRPDMVRILLEKGTSPETYHDEVYGKPILAAARVRSAVITRLLLDAGANVDVTDKYGFTPLIVATRNGDLGLVKLLLERGANLEHVTRTEPLPERQNIETNSSPSDWFEKEMESWDSSNPLIEACRYRHLDVVRELLKRGADISKMTSLANTALHVAAVGERKERYIPSEHAQAVGNLEQTSLPPCPEIVYILLQHGADVGARNRFQETPVIALLAEIDRITGKKVTETSKECLDFYYLTFCLLVQAGSLISSDCLTNIPATYKPRVRERSSNRPTPDVSSKLSLSILTRAHATFKYLKDRTCLLKKPSSATYTRIGNSNNEPQLQSEDQSGPERTQLNDPFTKAVELTVVSGLDLPVAELDGVSKILGYAISRPSCLRQLCQIKVREEIMKPQVGNIISKVSKERSLPLYLKQCIMLERDVPVVSLVDPDDAHCAP
ncbi:ankyrin-3-like [Lineus longissimus]|uniref:ankyrin-3-like n=1 Tax=Lineus longissimus TaxID=88925 RepID=UPI00315D93F6